MILGMQFAYPLLFIILCIIVFLCAIYKWFWYAGPKYSFTLLSEVIKLKNNNISVKSFIYKSVPFIIRLLAITSLIFASSRLQKVDQKTVLPVQGIDIMLVLDVSGSMQAYDDLKDLRTRIDVAKTEAVKFVQKRLNDQIGLVLFAREVLARCPLTLDKKVLSEIISEVQLGMIDYTSTRISLALLTALNRLSISESKSKIIILLTDGQPTPDDIDISQSIDLAKKLGVKIYTIGIGSDNGGYGIDPNFGVAVNIGCSLNKELLEKIAEETGGTFFQASAPKEMAQIYDAIDKLEKNSFESPIYANYFEMCMPFLILALLCLILELLITTFVWFIL
ncbi:VWA domain-containing protein [Candidatus Dependentiae bacterium]|nr:VWA domain-containing protein [Candidatus Dependentiae bacterium]